MLCARGLGRRPGLKGGTEEKVLEAVDFSFECDEIERRILCAEMFFDLFMDLWMGQHSVVRRAGHIVASGESGPNADFFLEFHDGQKEVRVQAEMAVESAQEVELFGRIVPIIADGTTNDGKVFLFHETAVVLSVGPTSREGDFVLGAVAQELIVDEL